MLDTGSMFNPLQALHSLHDLECIMFKETMLIVLLNCGYITDKKKLTFKWAMLSCDSFHYSAYICVTIRQLVDWTKYT